jgi:hypothetical protein
MPQKSSSPKKDEAARELRGVIDRFEGELAAIVFDDDQKLDCPKELLPPEAHSGDAIVARIIALDRQHLSGEWSANGLIELSSGQSINWPGKAATGLVSLSIEIDAADTTVRKERVRKLVDDIFNQNS